jgi:hypothetical protein
LYLAHFTLPPAPEIISLSGEARNIAGCVELRIMVDGTPWVKASYGAHRLPRSKSRVIEAQHPANRGEPRALVHSALDGLSPGC